jgi:cytochrome c-type biogenesis protein CcmF
MTAELGIVTTGLAFLAAVYALAAALFGAYLKRDTWVVSARNAALMTFPLLSAANLLLIYAMLNHDFSIAYVWQASSRDTPTFYLITGLWGSQAGSLLFWSWLMSGFTFAALLLNWKSQRRLMPWVIVATMATLGFFLILNNFFENPFERYWILSNGNVESSLFSPASGATVIDAAQTNGQGLNPLLRDPGMVFHPPMLYLGFVGLVIPFAFAFAALATGQLGSSWLRATRAWALVAWLFLSLGLLLGGWWAYHVLGWGGYWGWDPVENSALLPWLTATAFLHSAVVQSKRGMLKFWNMLLIIVTFQLVILGTFATRSGVISSVHAFAESQIGRPMFAFLGLSLMLSLVLLLWRQERGDLRGADELDSLFSKEAFFLLNNWLFLGLTVVVLWGTWAEAITTIMVDLGLRHTIINLGPDYFPPVTRWFLAGIFLLMGVAPLAAWRRSTAQRLGRALAIPAVVSVALIVLLVATGTGDLWALAGYGLVAFVAVATVVEIVKGVLARRRRGEDPLTAFWRLVGRDHHRYGGYFIHLGMVVLGIGVIGSTAFQKTTTQTLNVGDQMTLNHYTLQYNGLYQAQAEDGRMMVIAKGDFYARIEHWDGNTVTFRVYWNPLINFVWGGGIVLILGTLVALWPSPETSQSRRRVSVPSGVSGVGAGGAD